MRQQRRKWIDNTSHQHCRPQKTVVELVGQLPRVCLACPVGPGPGSAMTAAALLHGGHDVPLPRYLVGGGALSWHGRSGPSLLPCGPLASPKGHSKRCSLRPSSAA
eukprot:1510112-Pyramimonas_sp.AAC.1